jgi:hypothetical protein
MLSIYNTIVDTYTSVLRDKAGKSDACGEQAVPGLMIPSAS